MHGTACRQRAKRNETINHHVACRSTSVCELHELIILLFVLPNDAAVCCAVVVAFAV